MNYTAFTAQLFRACTFRVTYGMGKAVDMDVWRMIFSVETQVQI